MKLYKQKPHDGSWIQCITYHQEATLSDIRAAANEMGYAVVPMEVAKYYATESNYTSGDVPGHIYALDDCGGMMQAALSQEDEQ